MLLILNNKGFIFYILSPNKAIRHECKMYPCPGERPLEYIYPERNTSSNLQPGLHSYTLLVISDWRIHQTRRHWLFSNTPSVAVTPSIRSGDNTNFMSCRRRLIGNQAEVQYLRTCPCLCRFLHIQAPVHGGG